MIKSFAQESPSIHPVCFWGRNELWRLYLLVQYNIRNNKFPACLGCYSASALENEVILTLILIIYKQQSELHYCYPITPVIFGNTPVMETMTWATMQYISLCCWSTFHKLLLSLFKWRLCLVTYWLQSLCILISTTFALEKLQVKHLA